MIEINLLPKDLKRGRLSFKLDRNLVMAFSGAAALLGVMLIYSFFFQQRTISSLEKQLAISKAETSKYTSEIVKIDEIGKKKEQILARMTTIQLLDKNREYWVSLLEDLAPRPPNAAPAANTSQTASKSTIEGYSFSLNSLATFLIRLKKSDYVDKIEISSIKLQQVEKAEAYNFKLNCDLVTPAAENLDVQTAQAINEIQNQF
jgi:type IV pilus assembly protein PilN